MDEEIANVVYKFRRWSKPEEVRLLTDQRAFFSCSADHNKSEYRMTASWTFFEDMRHYGEESFELSLREDVANLWHIFSTSLSWQNDSLWRSFAEGYKGYCLGFNTLDLLKSFRALASMTFPLTVRYYSKEEGPPHYCFDDWESWNVGDFIKFLHSLPDVFNEEEEVRIVSTYKGELPFSLDCVTEIMIGEYADEKTQCEIFRIKESIYPNASIYRVKYCDTLQVAIREPFV